MCVVGGNSVEGRWMESGGKWLLVDCINRGWTAERLAVGEDVEGWKSVTGREGGLDGYEIGWG